MRARSLSAEYLQLQPEIVAAFGRVDSMACLARRHGVTVQTVERLIRRALVGRGTVAGRADQHSAAPVGSGR